MVESDGEFVEFESPEYGIRAITKVLQTYSKNIILILLKKYLIVMHQIQKMIQILILKI